MSRTTCQQFTFESIKSINTNAHNGVIEMIDVNDHQINFTIPFGMNATLDYVVVEMHTVTLYIDVIDPLPIV